MSQHHPHYFHAAVSQQTIDAAKHDELDGPTFVGQGISRSSGSDTYGYYILSLTKTKTGKPLVGICQATSVMHGDWTDGTMDCSIDMDTAVPTSWLTTYGKHPDGRPQWYLCDSQGNRKFGSHPIPTKVRFNWNGAFAYRDPHV